MAPKSQQEERKVWVRESEVWFCGWQNLNATQIQARIETTASTSTIRKVLQQDKFMKFSKLMKKPKLELRHAKARLEFAEKHPKPNQLGQDHL